MAEKTYVMTQADKDSYVGKWDYYPLFYAYTGQQGTLTKNY